MYESDAPWAQRARDTMFAFDLAVLAYVVVTSFTPPDSFIESLHTLIGFVLLLELLARLSASRNLRRELLDIWNWVDAVAIATFIAPVTGEALGFLRAVRLVRVMRLYRVLDRLRDLSPVFRRNEEAIIAGLNLCVFIFVMTGMVFTTQHRTNPQIHNYADALYFTVTSLTTTGFGDITLQGTTGRMLSVVIMFMGVTLFLQLAQAMFRPSKVRFECPGCSLLRHEVDAVHCKACGTMLHLPNDGD